MAGRVFAFWSYARFDDERERGKLSTLRQELEAEIRRATGIRDFAIFQDRKDIGWGQSWKQVIRTGLEHSAIFFPILTPLWFTSEACREELEDFQERQRVAGRDDLILPLYYYPTGILDDAEDLVHASAAERAAAEYFLTRNWEDWRQLRREPQTGAVFAEAVERLAQRAKAPLRAGLRAKAAAPVPPADPKPSATPTEVTAGSAAAPDRVTPTTPTDEGAGMTRPREIPTLVVDSFPGRDGHKRIGDAIQAAEVGARILVRPGTYREDVVIDKPVEIIGDGDRDSIVIESVEKNSVKIDTNMARLKNLSIRQRPGAKYYALHILQGDANVEDCDISSGGLDCVAVSGTAAPTVRRCRIHDGAQGGIFVFGDARGVFEDNDVYGNALAGIMVADNADPVVRRNRIRDGKRAGIFVYEGGRGTFDDNEIYGNDVAGIAVNDNADPVVRRNRIRDGKQGGIFVDEGGRGTFDDNEIYGNAKAGIEVREDADPVVRRNSIRDGKSAGIFVHTGGRGTFDDNEIRGNALVGIEVREGGAPVIRNNRVNGNGYEAIWIHDEGAGVYEGNDLSGNARGAWDIDESSLPLVTRKNNKE